MSRNRATVMPALLAVGLLAGCAGTPQVPTDVATTGMPNAELALHRTLDQVNSEMTQIGSMRPAAYGAGAQAAPVVPDDLQKPVQFVWTGPLDAGVQKLAASVGYTVAIFGPHNPQPVPVAVNVDGQVLGAFRALGMQAGTAATVDVDPLHHQIKVVHHV